MTLVLDRREVLEVYAEAAAKRWVLPAFNTENLTTIEAVLAAVKDFGKERGRAGLPIIIGITNTYTQRPQSVYYTHSRDWKTGLELFLKDLEVLASKISPYGDLRIMAHLDHIQWDIDAELLSSGMERFSSIMYDASTLPLARNIELTAAFVERYGQVILIEGAPDEIEEASRESTVRLTSPGEAERYAHATGVDLLVANLGTEHRAAAAERQYHGGLARRITERIGPRLCLHGTSSLSVEQLAGLFDDGIRKVNIWTALERDSAPALFRDMLENAASVLGPDKTADWIEKGLLGKEAGRGTPEDALCFTTTHRQGILFEEMKKIVIQYLRVFYP